MSLETKPIYEFGPFRLDSGEHLLYRSGQAVPLTPKAFEALLVLVEKHGHVVGKEELMKRLWPETFVEEGSLTFNISVLRKVLGDDRQNGNRFIETVPRRGYRFIATVVLDHGPGSGIIAAEPAPAATEQRELEPRFARRKSRAKRLGLILLGVSLSSAALFVYSLGRPAPMPTILGQTQLTHDGLRKEPGLPMLTDGMILYFTETTSDGLVLAQVSTSGGETSTIQTPFEVCSALDVSASAHAALVRSCGSGSLSPLWVQPLPVGSPRLLGEVRAYGAGWAPDGRTIAYTGQQGIYLVDANGANLHKIATVPEVPSSSPRWSPDGKLLRFSVVDTQCRYSHWEVSSDGSNLQEILQGWMTQGDFLGDWTPDGKYYMFSFLTEGRSDIWAIPERNALFGWGKREPVQLTHGPMNYSSPVPSADGRKLFAIGWQQRGELVRWDSRLRDFVRFLGGISAHWVGFSKDGQWVAYLQFPEDTLWRMRPDGSDRRQLTFKPMDVDGLEWAPDGRQIAFRAKKPDQPHRPYVISVQGGEPLEILPQRREEVGIPTWSQDGKQIAFGDVPILFGHGNGSEVIHLYDLSTRQLSSLPDSKGLWTSRWSPEGRYIVALTIAKQELMLFDTQSGKWRDLSVDLINNPTWSHNGKYIYFDKLGAESNSGIFRVRISDGKLERVATFNGMRRAAYWWSGVAPDDSPIVLRDIGTQEIYALDVEWP